MSHKKLSNISLSDFRKFLKNEGLKCISTKGGHEKWVRKDLLRPIILQTHITPVPEFIVKQVIRHLNMSREEFWIKFQKL